MTIRLAHFVTHPIQYFAPLYRQLAAQPGVELTVLFGSDFGLRPSFDEGFGSPIRFDVPLLDGVRRPAQLEPRQRCAQAPVGLDP